MVIRIIKKGTIECDRCKFKIAEIKAILEENEKQGATGIDKEPKKEEERLSDRAKFILRNSLETFGKMNEKGKWMTIKHVKGNLDVHFKAVETIGTGYAADMVAAGLAFLKSKAVQRLILPF